MRVRAPGQLAAVIARPDKLAPKPTNITFEQAAALPISGTTALRAVRDEANVQPGQRVLVTTAARSS